MKSVEWLLAKADKAYECGDPFKSQGDKLKQEAFDREIMIEKIRARVDKDKELKDINTILLDAMGWLEEEGTPSLSVIEAQKRVFELIDHKK